jgi:hypothetical protein
MYAQNQVVIHTPKMLTQKTNVFIISYVITKTYYKSRKK